MGISTTTLSRWNTESPPRIPFVRLSKGNYRWRKSELEAYLERQLVDRRNGTSEFRSSVVPPTVAMLTVSA